MWESPLRITLHAIGACTDPGLICRLPRRRCQQPFRSRLTTAPLLSLAAEGAHSSAKASSAEGEERQTRYLPDPNAIIAAAWKAAGLVRS